MHPRAQAIFEEAIEKSDAEREEFVQRACGEDQDLFAEVVSLLRAHDQAQRFMSGPTDGGGAATMAATANLTARESAGAKIGPYKLLQQIGEGGFGVVFLAEQEQPVRRRVALKIIKLGMDTRQVIARFEAERQALALMDHPNIARVLDAGATAEGRPYFVMELVRGDPITEYCDRNHLDTDQRLELFIQICHAVQHAHQKGIIHRDVKPSNVLVTIADGRAIPKVIDFGIAKATSARLTEKTLFTEHRALIGTPEYMSPEQAEMSGVDIDTRSDIYSLGVLLYELLTGTTPFDSRQLRSAAFAEIQRIIREVEPPKPSTRLSTLHDSIAGIAAHRRTDPGRLSRIIRGDLDWIVMRCLEKDRTRRYETASSLAEDVRRHLLGEPVLAAPPSSAYRAHKFVRRHKAGVAAASAIAAALLAGMAGTWWQSRVAAGQRDAAQNETKRADDAATAERERADQLKQVSDFQESMLAQVNATEAGKRLTDDVTKKLADALAKTDLPEAERASQVETFSTLWRKVNVTDAARELLDSTILKPAVQAIETQFKDQPLVDAQLRQVLADRYNELGLYEPAQALQEKALATRRRLLGDEHPDTLTSINLMGVLMWNQGRLDEADSYYSDALEKRRRVLGNEHADTIQSISNMALLRRDQGKDNEAETLHLEALETSRRVLGEEHPDTLISINNISLFYQDQGMLAKAEEYCREALEKRRRVLGDEHSQTLTSINNMGLLLHYQGKFTEAEPYYRESLDKSRRLQGDEHPDTLITLNNMGALLRSLRRYDEAEACYREALEKRRRVLGPEHPHTLTSMGSMGALLRDQGKLDEAESYLRETMELRRRLLGEDHDDTLASILNVGMIQRARGEFTDTIGLLEPIEVKVRAAYVGDNAYVVAALLTALGRSRVGLGYDPARFAQAEANLLEAHSILVEVRGETHKDTRDCAQSLVDLYQAWDAAEPGKGYDAKAGQWRDRTQPQPATSPGN